MEESIFGDMGVVDMSIVKDEKGDFKIKCTRKNSKGEILEVWYKDDDRLKEKKKKGKSSIMFGDTEL